MNVDETRGKDEAARVEDFFILVRFEPAYGDDAVAGNAHGHVAQRRSGAVRDARVEDEKRSGSRLGEGYKHEEEGQDEQKGAAFHETSVS
jgi:hypothetical protein